MSRRSHRRLHDAPVDLWLAGGLIPGWRHEIVPVEVTPTLLRTQEHGGLVRQWNHELRFEPVPGDPGRCRYTDHVEIDAGRLTPAVVAVATGLYRWRQRRWRKLAELVA